MKECIAEETPRSERKEDFEVRLVFLAIGDRDKEQYEVGCDADG